MSSASTLPAVANGAPPHRYPIDHDAVMKAVGINIRDPNAQALLLTCERYGLDPILKHMILIQGRPYITRDGLLHVAHRSGQFDGIEVLEQGETASHHTAKVSVYRKDMGRPFTYIGRYPKNGGNRAYGPEMAVKCGEVMALRRAFNVALCAREEVWDQDVEAEPATAYVEPADHGRPAVNEDFPARRAVPADDYDAGAVPTTWPSFAAARAKAHNDWLERVYESEGVDQSARHHFKVNSHQLSQVVAGKAVEKGLKAPAKKTQGWASDVADRLWRTKPTQVEAVVDAYLKSKVDEARQKFGLPDPEDAFEEGTAGEIRTEDEPAAEPREPGSDDDAE